MCCRNVEGRGFHLPVESRLPSHHHISLECNLDRLDGADKWAVYKHVESILIRQAIPLSRIAEL